MPAFPEVGIAEERPKMDRSESLKRARDARWKPRVVEVDGQELVLKSALDAKRVLALVLRKTYSGELPPQQGGTCIKAVAEFTKAAQLQQNEKTIRKLRAELRELKEHAARE